MLTDRQKSEREASLGSSDAPILAGVSRYKSPLELYYQIHGELPRYTDEETQWQRIGARLEPVIAEIAAEEIGVKIRRCPTKRHPQHSFMVANLDYEIVGDPKGAGVFEVKNRSGERPWDTIPDDVMLQCVHQMAVTRREWGRVAAMFQFGVIKTYELVRDKELEEYLIELESRFMVHVQRGEPPDHTWTSSTVGMLKKLYPTDSGQTIQLPDQAAINAEGFLQAKAEVEAAEERKALYEGLLKEAVNTATVAECPGYKITWKSTKAGTKFNYDQFAKDHPELVEEYTIKTPGYRRFSVKPTKELVKS